MKRFKDWLFKHKYTPNHNTFDCGRTCANAIYKFKEGKKPLSCGGTNERDNGNGSLMRIAPLPLYLFAKYGPTSIDKEEYFEEIHNISRLTHAHPISLIGCDIYCSIMLEILKGAEKKDIMKFALPKIGSYVDKEPKFNNAKTKYARIFHINFKDTPEYEIRSSGYVVDTLEAVIWCFLNTDNYKDCVLKAVNLGSDTDTVACVAGSMAGLYYGELPEKWIKAIRNKKLIDKIIFQFSQKLCEY